MPFCQPKMPHPKSFLRLDCLDQRFLNSPGMEMWAVYQDMLVFALGRIGAFDALNGVNCPVGFTGVQAWTYSRLNDDRGGEETQRAPFRALLWRVHAVLDSIFDELPQFRFRRIRGGLPQFVDYEGLSARVVLLLEEVFHLDMEARLEAMRYYERSMYLVNTMDLACEIFGKIRGIRAVRLSA